MHRFRLLLAATAVLLPAAAHGQQAPFEVAVAEDTLGAVAGREDVQQEASAVQTAQVSRNSVGDHVTTGAAKIDGQAFQNLSGLSILNVNTGNNVAINAAMNVTISLSPPTP
jgi:hypothetical protein